MYYDNLLKLCGYEPEEIERERPRVERTFEKAELTPEDVIQAEKGISRYYNVEVEGVSQSLGLWLKCFIDVVLAKEEGKKVVYASAPPFYYLMAAIAGVSKDIYVCMPGVAVGSALGTIFGKTKPILEAAEGDLLPPALANCAQLQLELGGILKGVIPIPDLILSMAYACDQTPELDERIGERYGVPIIYVEGPNDQMGGDWPVIHYSKIKYIAEEAKSALAKFEEFTGHEVTEDHIRRSLRVCDGIFEGDKRLRDLYASADPLPINFSSFVSIGQLAPTLSTTLMFDDVRKVLDLAYMGIKKRIDRGEGVLPKGAPRIRVFTPWITDPSVSAMIENAGLAIIGYTGTEITDSDQRESEHYKDIWEQGARIVSTAGPPDCGLGASKALAEVCRQYKKGDELDGVLLNYWFTCRPNSLCPIKMKELITQESGIPTLVLESNMFDTRDINTEALRTRIEAFAEVLKAAKLSKSH
jgi:benzoyl-CoA reductase/2-hydroxyglutaryl-CoA dehydratase subunit BcrC/BadD/HgdB